MTLEEFKALNKKIGNHWFSDNTMEFFDSQVHDFDESSGFFITSERGPTWREDRKYTIRHADFMTGRVRKASEFQEFPTLSQCRTRFKRIIL